MLHYLKVSLLVFFNPILLFINYLIQFNIYLIQLFSHSKHLIIPSVFFSYSLIQSQLCYAIMLFEKYLTSPIALSFSNSIFLAYSSKVSFKF